MHLLYVALNIVIIYLSLHTSVLLSECPQLCDCIWKSGKESVICLHANLSVVPLHLEAGTQVLDLTGNNLVTIKHDEFSQAGLLNLQRIYVSKCRLKSLDRYAFRNLINLVELDLSYNALATVPSHVFDSIPELRELKLSGNPIQRITNDAFIHVPQLVRLELSECRIGTVEPKAFNGLQQSLEWLKVDKNKLVELQSNSIIILRSLHGLDLAGNPWNCSCALRPLREWMLRKNVPFGVPPVCQYPKRLASKTWDKLDLDEFACVPEIFAYDTKAHGVEGKNVTMTCRITGIPEPHVKWLSKNKVIANLSGTPYSNGKKLYIVHLQNNASDLTILTADLQDAGVYVCSAENKAGRAEASVTLAVSRKPPESPLTNKILIISIVAGVLFVMASCLAAMCICTLRKKQAVRWRRRDCHIDDNYEKIEMNHKVSDSANGGTNQGDISVVGGFRKNGEYRVVPGVDTDQEVDDEEDGAEGNAQRNQKETKFITPGKADSSLSENKWNSPDRLLDTNDLHIPRRPLTDTRDDFKAIPTSMSGTYNSTYQLPSSSASCNIPKNFQSHVMRKQILENANATVYTSTYSSDLSSLAESESERKYPDLLENSSSPNKFNTINSTKANSEGGSITDISEIFCTLPRKRGLKHNSRYISTESQFPLLPESRYGSSGGESNIGSRDSCRRLSDSQKYPLSNLSKNRVNQRSTSFVNLASVRQSSVPPSPIHELEISNATPLLDIAGLENRSYNQEIVSPSMSSVAASNANTYDYHAAQLERFLEEYRSLQKQLTKMKETCDNLRQDKTKYLDPLQNNSPLTPTSLEEGNLRSILKHSPSSLIPSPNSNQTLESTLCFPSYENDLSRYLKSNNKFNN